jgi:hypothetical protein
LTSFLLRFIMSCTEGRQLCNSGRMQQALDAGLRATAATMELTKFPRLRCRLHPDTPWHRCGGAAMQRSREQQPAQQWEAHQKDHCGGAVRHAASELHNAGPRLRAGWLPSAQHVHFATHQLDMARSWRKQWHARNSIQYGLLFKAFAQLPLLRSLGASTSGASSLLCRFNFWEVDTSIHGTGSDALCIHRAQA